MALQGSSYNLQGGSRGISLQGSRYNPQKTISVKKLQPAASVSVVQPAAKYTTIKPSATLVTGGGGGGGGGGTSSPTYTAPAPPPDPYARWGGYAGYQAAENNYNQTKNLTYGSIEDAIDDTVLGTKSSILDFITSYGQEQKAINKRAVRNELTREQKRWGILDMVGQGLRNGQVMLNNANASSSSAGEQIARAYGRMGQKQMTQANLDYNLGAEDIADAQEALGINLETFRRKYGEDKTMAANKIVQNAVGSLSSLDQLALTGGVGGRINVEAEKVRIRNQALAELGALDTVFNEGVAKVKPADRATNRKEAHQLLGGGYVPENQLGFDTTLPIYTLGA